MARTKVTGIQLSGVDVARQNDTTNSLLANARIETGWGYIVNNTGASAVSEAITYRTAFTTAPIVIVVCGGDSASGTTYGAGGINLTAGVVAEAHTVLTTGFTVYMKKVDGTNLASGNTFYQWIAIGV